MSKLQFKTQKDCDRFFEHAKRASKSAQGKRKAPKATDCVEKLKAKIHHLEKANEGLMNRIMELERKQ